MNIKIEGISPTRVIPTIKTIRLLTGLGLKEAKDLVELARYGGSREPDGRYSIILNSDAYPNLHFPFFYSSQASAVSPSSCNNINNLNELDAMLRQDNYIGDFRHLRDLTPPAIPVPLNMKRNRPTLKQMDQLLSDFNKLQAESAAISQQLKDLREDRKSIIDGYENIIHNFKEDVVADEETLKNQERIIQEYRTEVTRLDKICIEYRDRASDFESALSELRVQNAAEAKKRALNVGDEPIQIAIGDKRVVIGADSIVIARHTVS